MDWTIITAICAVIACTIAVIGIWRNSIASKTTINNHIDHHTEALEVLTKAVEGMNKTLNKNGQRLSRLEGKFNVK